MAWRALSIWLLLFAGPLLGQEPSLDPGVPLRVRAQGLTLNGDFVRWNADTLVVRPANLDRSPGPSAHRAVVRSDILGLDRQVPRSHGRGAARGALWGGVIGGAAGAILGAWAASGCESFCVMGSPGEAGLLGGALLGGMGAGVGALVGAVIPGTRWEPVPLEGDSP